jgi:hypothetical protein
MTGMAFATIGKQSKHWVMERISLTGTGTAFATNIRIAGLARERETVAVWVITQGIAMEKGKGTGAVTEKVGGKVTDRDTSTGMARVIRTPLILSRKTNSVNSENLKGLFYILVSLFLPDSPDDRQRTDCRHSKT